MLCHEGIPSVVLGPYLCPHQRVVILEWSVRYSSRQEHYRPAIWPDPALQQASMILYVPVEPSNTAVDMETPSEASHNISLEILLPMSDPVFLAPLLMFQPFPSLTRCLGLSRPLAVTWRTCRPLFDVCMFAVTGYSHLCSQIFIPRLSKSDQYEV